MSFFTTVLAEPYKHAIVFFLKPSLIQKPHCQDQDLSTGNGSCIYGVPDMCIILKRRRVRRITKLTKKKRS